jgi:regulatory protein
VWWHEVLRRPKKQPERGQRAADGQMEPAPQRVGPCGDAPASPRAGPSLRTRALGLLAMREHSRVELRRKLAPHAESDEALSAVLDALEQAGHMSERRFVESLIRRRSQRYGSRLIEHELQGHRIADDISGPLLRELGADERQRALEVWRKRFGRAPEDLKERAKQQRFLAQRGFDAEVISAVFRAIRDGSAGQG